MPSTHYGEYPYDVSWSLMKEINFFLNPPFFYFHGNYGKVCPTDSDFFGLSRSTICGCDRKHYCKIFWSLELNLTFFVPWLPWQQPPFRICSTPKSCHTLRWIFLQSFMKFDERNQNFLNPPFFCFHGNCSNVCPTDSDFFLAYLVPLDVDVVSIKFHEVMFVPTMFHEVWWKK